MVKAIRTFSDNKALVYERRTQIIKKASTLFMKKGYDRTSVREMAKALDMSPGGLYHYIGSKDDILHLALDFSTERDARTLDRMHDEVARLRPTDALRKSIRMYLESVNEYQDMYNFLNHVIVNLTPNERQVIFNNQINDISYFEKLLREGVEVGEFEVDNPNMVAHNIVLVGNAWANRRWYLRKRYTSEEYITKQTKLIMKQIGVNLR